MEDMVGVLYEEYYAPHKPWKALVQMQLAHLQCRTAALSVKRQALQEWLDNSKAFSQLK